MTKIYLLRHGQVDAPAGLYGKTDVAVNDSVNLEIMSELLKHQYCFTDIVSSPLSRCSNLAKQFSIQTNKPFKIVDDFQEMDFGELDGVTFEKALSTSDDRNIWQILERFWQAPAENHLPAAESLNSFNQRISSAWKELLKHSQGKAILLVTHGGVIRTILANILGLDHDNAKLYSQLSIDNASVTCVEHCDDTNFSRVKHISMPLAALAFSKEAEPNV